MNETEIRKAFLQRFRQLVAESNQTQVEIAKGTGINKKLLNRYLQGDLIPRTYNLVRISIYFGVSADWLLGLTNERRDYEKADSVDLGDSDASAG